MPAPVQFGNQISLNVGNFSPAGQQFFPSIAATANGHFCAAWNTDNGHQAAFFRADGLTATALRTFSVANGVQAAANSQVDLATLSDGRVVMAWTNTAVDGAGDTNFVYLSEATGQSAITTIALPGAQSEVAVAAGTAGQFVYVNKGDGAGSDVFRSAFSSAGASLFGSDEISNGTGVAGNQEQPNIAALSDGRYITVWADRTDGKIKGTILFADGARPFGPPLVLTETAPGSATQQDDLIGVTGLGNGGFAISYRNPNDGEDVQYRLFNSAGVATTALLTVAGLGAYGQAALGLPDGRIVLVSATVGGDVQGQMVKADGALDGGIFVIAGDAVAQEFQPSLTLLTDGRFAVAYSTTNLAGGVGRDIAMKIFDPREAGVNVSGTADADEYFGSRFVDTFNLGAGNDTVNGGAGSDTSIYSVVRTSATITRNLDGTVNVSAGAQGADLLTNMEWAQFTDGNVWIGAQHNDSNNDGRSDILWQNNSGQAAIWQMNGATVVSAAALVDPGASWKLIGSGDFNADRKADLLWQNTDGSIAEWQMDGTTIANSVIIGNPGSSLHATCVGDFNGDGYSDIAMQDVNGQIAIWDMNGTNIVGVGAPANPGAAWHLEAAADFNADGTSDLLFQHDDGSVAIWRMNGTSLISGAVLPQNPGSAWHIKGTGDFNKDGRADIVWQHNDGTVAVWSMQDATTMLTGPTTGVVAAPGSALQVGGVGDFNGDNVSDLMLQNINTGQAALWTMNGTNLTPMGTILAQNAGTSWHMVS